MLLDAYTFLINTKSHKIMLECDPFNDTLWKGWDNSSMHIIAVGRHVDASVAFILIIMNVFIYYSSNA